MNNEPKGRIPASDIHIVLSVAIKVEAICPELLEEARTIQRIARMAQYDADYQARQERLCHCHEEEYPYILEDEEPVARFMHRLADDDECERF